MMKHSKRFLCLLLTLILAASLCVFPAAAADQTCPSSKDDPVVFVHGLMGWGQRAGINAVDKGQWEAARSVGLSEIHMMTHVIMPQAVKNILPALCNEFITTVKGTSLASVFFVGELMTSYKSVQAATFLALQSLTIVGVIYFLLNFILSRLLRVLERRLTASD